MSKPKLPGVGLGLAGEDPQQTRLAGAVQSHHEQSLPALNLEVDAAEHGRATVSLGEPLDRNHNPAAVRRVREFDFDLAFAPWRGDLLRLEAIDALEDRLRGAGSFLGLATH